MISKLVKNENILSLLANLVTSGIAFLSFIFLAHIFSVTNLGIWTLYLTMFTFIDMFRTGVIHTALIRFASGDNQEEYIGASWKILVYLTFGVSILVALIGWIGKEYFYESSMGLFFMYFPILFIANLPVQMATWVLQLQRHYQKILYVRILSTVPFFICLSVHFFIPYLTLSLLTIFHFVIFLVASLLVMYWGWTGIEHIKKGEKTHQKELLDFGKYSTGSLIGTNLLKSSDTFLISWLLGPVALAFYSIPQKLTELMELPIRSFATTALPKLSKASMLHDYAEVRKIFIEYVLMATVLILPVVLSCIFFAKYLVLLVGGEKYQSATIILQVFAVYGLFLPLDKFLGVTLDCLNFPKFNMIKVFFMVFVNVVLDVIVIFLVKEVWAVAAVTTLTMIAGIIVGMIYLNRIIKFKKEEVKKHGVAKIKAIYEFKF